ncbi:hypothetical protein DAPPUDRAFT_97469 [Daphnia pulex]|uniref:3CxxC-type domain-containing protein n=1 Tax=Daphnia pulex TaxID=6669 RepID=E9G1F5_DAPPU|nr:hypothetical protein DAPPUDRAFT_97469 [Daphnia pulex]|eukprot:EFX86492.1 hypothetical protein DAPPUDRAFT_97469 [Daphnia pulex]
MSFSHHSTEFSDAEFESSSDSGLSVESFEISSELAVFSHRVIGIFLPLSSVELVPIQLPCYPSSKDKSSHHQVNKVQFNHRLIKWSLPPPSTPPVPLPGWNAMPYGLETFWQSAFCWFFRPFVAAHGHLWTLEPTELPPLSVEWPWHSTSFSAKVRFQCKCTRGWTSMKGRVSFWFRIRRQGDQVLCEALFKLFGQKCNICNQPDSFNESEFLTPLWYPEEIENAIRLLASHVSMSYYGEQRNAQDIYNIVRIRHSQPRKKSLAVHHHPIRCQACLYGSCATISLSNTCKC